MDSSETFDRLVVGLAEFLRQGIKYPYPGLLCHACNKLALEMIAVSYPHTFKGFLALLEEPVRAWYPLKLPEEFDSDFGLLYEGELSEEANQYLYEELIERAKLPETATASAKQIALENFQFQRLLERLQKVYTDSDPGAAQQEYVLLRRFLIEHPYTTLEELRQTFSRTRHISLEEVGELYEDCLTNAPYWNCNRCGPLTEKYGQLKGIKPKVCNDHRKDLSYIQQIPWQRGLRRIKFGIHCRVCLPGIPEMRLFRTLEQLHEQHPNHLYVVHIYPGIDRYDLQLQFGDGSVWAVDVKDYSNPYNLAPKLIPLYSEGELRYDESFYVIPSQRLSQRENYIRILREEAIALPESTHLVSDILFERQVIAKIEQLHEGE